MIAKQPDKIMPADNMPGPRQGQWTYSHYLALPDDGRRYEIVDGVLYMAPSSPTWWHQSAAGTLYYYLMTHVKYAGLGNVFIAPLDVELASHTVVQPDVVVLLNRNLEKCTSSHIIGAPDLVVEVLSPGTAAYDRHQKYNAYARAGVQEYWVVVTEREAVEVFFLETTGYYLAGTYSGEDTIRSLIVPHFPVQVKQFFS
ncbi:MAG TPA: Uma2 family endonuclease [Ktedonosporobacter sp.]|jgi:Uma2 family endonuclease|nr:Uma2 family endonuclease [Ktedonosporobacter sp.]